MHTGAKAKKIVQKKICFTDSSVQANSPYRICSYSAVKAGIFIYLCDKSQNPRRAEVGRDPWVHLARSLLCQGHTEQGAQHRVQAASGGLQGGDLTASLGSPCLCSVTHKVQPTPSMQCKEISQCCSNSTPSH